MAQPLHAVRQSDPTQRTGTLANGMEYLAWGIGPRTLLFVPGGPGSELPRGPMLRMLRRMLAPVVDAGFTAWVVTRRRHMPAGHGLAEMATDYADVVASDLGGRVDLVVGMSYGGMIAQYLAAFHAERFERVAIVAAACEVSPWGRDVDSRLAVALAQQDRSAAGAAFLEYVLPGDRWRAVRGRLGRVVGRLALSGPPLPSEDLLAEARAEEAFDTRSILAGIRVPVLMVCGDRDLFFPRGLVEETAALIPGCTLVWRPGKGHVRTCSDRRVGSDLLAFVNRR